MIKFFRRIRQQLLTEIIISKPASPVGRYLFYAIGEIVLVVIGILIALSINSWNQDRVLKVQEEKILTTLLVDLKQAKASSLEFLEGEKEISNGIVNILSGIEDRNAITKSEDADSLYSQVIWHMMNGIPIINTYTDLKNAGQTSLISNENIRIKFTSLENSLYELKEQVNDRLNFQQMHCDGWAIKNMNFVRTLTFRAISQDIDYGAENDYSKMFNDQNFLNLIAGKLALSTKVIKDRNSLLEEISTLIELVENELKKN
jgi:hypothetical protein